MKIESSELRRGNWINFIYTYKKKQIVRAVSVLEILESHVVTDDNGVKLALILSSDHCAPIELSPSVLEDCGFVGFSTNTEMTLELYNDGESSSGYITCFDKRSPDTRLFLDLHDRNSDWVPQNVCKVLDTQYLHQLQNLFFSLVGKELEYKPT